MRAEFGALQNRLQSVINNIQISKENMASANSRIRDADVAEESTNLTRNNILMQSGVSVLGQANTTIKTALNLLGGQS
jgi:flagellin